MQPIGDSSIEIWDIYIITDFYKGKDESSVYKDLLHLDFIQHFDNQHTELLNDYGYFSHLFLNKTQIERKEALCGKS